MVPSLVGLASPDIGGCQHRYPASLPLLHALHHACGWCFPLSRSVVVSCRLGSIVQNRKCSASLQSASPALKMMRSVATRSCSQAAVLPLFLKTLVTCALGARYAGKWCSVEAAILRCACVLRLPVAQGLGTSRAYVAGCTLLLSMPPAPGLLGSGQHDRLAGLTTIADHENPAP
jgi:hypothetical protein